MRTSRSGSVPSAAPAIAAARRFWGDAHAALSDAPKAIWVSESKAVRVDQSHRENLPWVHQVMWIERFFD